MLHNRLVCGDSFSVLYRKWLFSGSCQFCHVGALLLSQVSLLLNNGWDMVPKDVVHPHVWTHLSKPRKFGHFIIYHLPFCIDNVAPKLCFKSYVLSSQLYVNASAPYSFYCTFLPIHGMVWTVAFLGAFIGVREPYVS
jgi:hypothetical protein